MFFKSLQQHLRWVQTQRVLGDQIGDPLTLTNGILKPSEDARGWGLKLGFDGVAPTRARMNYPPSNLVHILGPWDPVADSMGSEPAMRQRTVIFPRSDKDISGCHRLRRTRTNEMIIERLQMWCGVGPPTSSVRAQLDIQRTISIAVYIPSTVHWLLYVDRGTDVSGWNSTPPHLRREDCIAICLPQNISWSTANINQGSSQHSFRAEGGSTRAGTSRKLYEELKVR
ncbi:uncharacterized protein EV422DRAFT_507261 [Fimicolochytrium jonesii]|uniref:uncharacterized protein n=1 Tax=Fimicolochytrium jonesii TaxID=1396493 RepID=UPI0022FEABC0|nr:uncharacterized protein EV422DRAFT_507261 [Fimicolochytrium jonesii]KAI8819624.1 hypothetical protein EV422DRAFT_507261 [Fimicolochytrium jonesii]